MEYVIMVWTSSHRCSLIATQKHEGAEILSDDGIDQLYSQQISKYDKETNIQVSSGKTDDE